MTTHDLSSSVSGDGLPDLTASMDLVTRYQGGDAAALERLLARYQDRIRRIVRIRLGSRLRENLESMDIVQEANVVVMRKLGDFVPRSPGGLLAWLSQIALNQVRDAARKMERRPAERLDASSAEDSEAPHREPSADGPMPDEQAWRTELREILDDSMTKLAEDQREVILLRDYCATSWPEIAAALARDSVPAVQELHRRAWIKLRRIARPRLTGLL